MPQLHHQPRRWLGWTSLLAAAALVAACGGDDGEPDTALPDFGPNVTIFDPSMRVEDINARLQALATRSDGFDESRSAVYFMPGPYGSEAGRLDPATATGHVDSPVGFMMTVQGLGASPDEVTINGNLRVGAFQVDALGTFWRSLSNLKIAPIQADEPAFTLRWNTSQASSLRRVRVAGHLDLSGGISFGSYVANSQVEGELRYGSGWEADRNPPVTGGVEQGPAQYLVRDGAVRVDRLGIHGEAPHFAAIDIGGDDFQLRPPFHTRALSASWRRRHAADHVLARRYRPGELSERHAKRGDSGRA